ncbi:MAG: CAP domain-containing protein, partial [bacterium]
SHTETFELKTTDLSIPQDFTMIVTAGFPSPAGDVSSVSGFRQGGQLIKGGAGTKVSFMVEDLQNDVTGVKITASELGAGDVWLSLLNGRWEGYVSNTGVNPGNYNLMVEAYSPNPQNAVTSNYYKAVVFYDLQSSRTQLLSLVNADRISGGIQSVSSDPYLDTVAQYHAQDMSAKHFFSHYNLDGWSPWQRMDYFGVSYGSAGENIAVGQDSVSEVEIAWMNSAGHKANIMNGSFKKVGLGIAPILSGDMYYPGYYWVQVFSD